MKKKKQKFNWDQIDKDIFFKCVINSENNKKKMSKEATISAINIINTILFVFVLFYTFSDINAMQSMFEKGCVCMCLAHPTF